MHFYYLEDDFLAEPLISILKFTCFRSLFGFADPLIVDFPCLDEEEEEEGIFASYYFISGDRQLDRY